MPFYDFRDPAAPDIPQDSCSASIAELLDRGSRVAVESSRLHTVVAGPAVAVTAPLGDLRILDFTHFVAGPWCTMLMADLGADIIKVEPPGRGEISRGMGNVYSEEDSAIFLGFNRGKRSVELDLTTSRGREVVGRLVSECDVVIHNFRPDAAARLGLDAATMTGLNSTVIHCAVGAFGDSGPLSSAPGNDPLIQGLSGAMPATDPNHPVRLGVSLPDFAGGILAAVAVLRCRPAAPAHRFRKRDQPQSSRCAAVFTDRSGRRGRASTQGLGDSVRDGSVWVDEPCAPEGSYMPADGVDAVLAVAAARGVAAVRVAALGDVLPGPPGRVLTLTRTPTRCTTVVRTPVHFEPAVAEPDRHPPMLGQHTREVLSEFGFSESEIAGLVVDNRGLV